MATVELRYDVKDNAWFTANASMVLKLGEPAYHESTGLFKLGDGTTQLSSLPFLPSVSSSQTLAQTLALGNTTGANDVIVDDNRFVYFGTSSNAGIRYRTASQALIINNTTSSDTIFLKDAGGIEVSTSAFSLPQLTASTVPYLDGSNVLRSSAVTPTQLGYLDATSSIQTQLNAKEATANKGVAGGYASLDGSGKIPSSQLSALAITDTFVVNSQAAMLALSTAETGDIAVRTDLNKTFILKGTTYSVLADWQELLTPTDSVLSVNGGTGAVTVTVTGTSNRITVSGGTGLTPTIDISSSYVGQNTITTLGTIGTGVWQGTSISTTYTDAKIKGSVGATAGLVPFGTGTADTVTTDSIFSYDNVGNQTGLVVGGTNVDVWLAGAVSARFLTVQTTTSNDLAIVNIAASGTGVAATNYGNATIRRGAINVVSGSHMEFYTNPTNSGTGLTKVFELTSAGNVVAGAQAALATNATNGFLYIPTCAGTPTGVPTSYTGKVAMIYDTTNNKFYIYNAGWKGGTAPGTFS